MNWKRALQLTLVHVGVAITAVPVNSTLNRIMIADLHFPSALVGFLISLPYLLSPFQVFIGDWSDRRPLWGRHRSPWIVLGGLMAAFGCYLTAHAVYLMVDHLALGLIAALVTFLIWGLGVNIASVSYLSLLSELSKENEGWRSRTVSIMWTAMILSTILTSLTIARLIEPYSVDRLYTAFGFVWMVAAVFVLVGAANIEPARLAQETVKHDAKHPLENLRSVLGNHSARRFFVYLLLVLISIHAQDVLLEPFGGEVLGLAPAQTSRLTSIWGLGVFFTLLGGLPLVRRWGKKPSANVGAIVAAFGFAGIIASGWLHSISVFYSAIFVLGLGGGLMTVSNLSFMLDMTIPQAAGLYMGAWGVANFAGQAFGNIASGILRDVLYALTSSVDVGYGVVFSIEIIGLLLAIWLFRTISVQEFRREAQVRLSDLLAAAGD
jgi:BCD family chlorophyll transporter-like MFS transporter